MSTDIAEIKGVYEVMKRSDTLTPEYSKAEMALTRYWGGENGAMLQLTIQSDRIAYIQLTQEQVKELIQVLQDAFDYEKYPSE